MWTRRADVEASFYPSRTLLRAAKACTADNGVLLRVVLVRALTAGLASPLGKETDA
jgi:hypothetical protein